MTIGEWHQLWAEQARAAKQEYQKKYASGEEALSWALKTFLDQLPKLAHGEGINDLLKLRGDIGAVQQKNPGACPAIVELITRELKLSPEAVKAALGLPPSAHDALDMLLLSVVREHAHEAHHGALLLSRIVDAVNVSCGLNEGLTHKFIGGRLRALGYVLTRHHPTSVLLIPRLLPPELDVALTRLLPSPEEPSARENNNNTQ
jgi:hypothetical protein